MTHQLRSVLPAEQQAGLVLDALGGSHSVTDVGKLSNHMGGSCNIRDTSFSLKHSSIDMHDWSRVDVSTEGAAVAYRA